MENDEMDDDELEEDVTAEDEAEMAPADGVDDSGVGAAIALLVALLTFLLAVAFVILRHVLFQA